MVRLLPSSLLCLLVILPSCAPSGPDASKSDFEKWTKIGNPRIYDRARKAPDGTQTADRVHLTVREGLLIDTTEPVAKGDTLTFSVMIWGRGAPEIMLQTFNTCSGAEDIGQLAVKVTNKPTLYTVSHTFTSQQVCPRTQMILTSTDNFVTFWKPTITITKGAPVPEAEPLAAKTAEEVAKVR